MVSKRVAEKLSRVYYDPQHPASLGSLNKLLKACPSLRKEEIREWLLSQPAYQKHRNRRKYFPRNKIYVTSMDEVFQGDLIDLPQLVKYNNKYRYVLTVIDLLSRYAWARPLKTKTGHEVVNALDSIFKERTPSRFNTDEGKEFINKPVQTYLKKKGVHWYPSYGNLKCSMVERWNRTLKNRMFRLMTKNNDLNYAKHLQKIVEGYNKAKHSTIGMAPIDVNINNEHLVWERLYSKKKTVKRPSLRSGDRVRITSDKGVFGKGYTGYWTEEIFIIRKVLQRDPPAYVIEDEDGEIISGAFYEPELQKI